MKILFLCGSLESSKDGVGDYTRRLAGELVRQGHVVHLVALHDHHIQVQNSNSQFDFEIEITCNRFPACIEWHEKASHVQAVVNNFNPDWISIQYVPYAFHHKGFAWQFNQFLNRLKFTARLHVMMHELWVGVGSQASLKHKIIGYIQKYFILKLLHSSKIDIITTSNVLYMKTLENNNIDIKKLPLFSNIAFVKSISEKIKVKFDIDSDYKLIAIFGTLYPDAKIDEILTEFLSTNNVQKFMLLSFGRIGNQDYWQQLQNVWQDRLLFKQLGPLDQEDVSAIMQLSDVAISCTPLEFLGKSGVYAAWKRHGVPVLVHHDQLNRSNTEIFYETYSSMEQFPAQNWDVTYVCNKFLNYLKEIHNSSKKP